MKNFSLWKSVEHTHKHGPRRNVSLKSTDGPLTGCAIMRVMAEAPRVHKSWESIVREHAEKPSPRPEQREAVRETVREHLEQAQRQRPATPLVAKPPPTTPTDTEPDLKEQEVRALEEPRQVVYLARLALEEGVEAAVELAERIGSPYVIDALHDHLVDELLKAITQHSAAQS